MPDSITIALIATCSTLAGVLVTQLFDLMRRRSEENRWFADYFLPKKYDAIVKLYGHVNYVNNILRIKKHKTHQTESEKQIDTVLVINELSDTFYMAKIYLDEVDQKAVDDLIIQFRMAGMYLTAQVTPVEYKDKGGIVKTVVFDWPKNLGDMTDAVSTALSKILMPEKLKQIEKRWSRV